jgi:hypothetical protein
MTETGPSEPEPLAVDLVGAWNELTQIVARERLITDTDAAIKELVIGGRRLHETISRLLDDKEFWGSVRTVRADDRNANRDKAAEVLAEQHVAILQALGFKEPPTAEELTDEMAEALAQLVGTPSSEKRRGQLVDNAQDALRGFNTRLDQLLRDKNLIEPSLKRRLLRRTLVTGGKAALLIAPVAVAVAVPHLSIPALAVHLGIHVAHVPDAVKETSDRLTDAVTTKVAAILPEATLHTADVDTVVAHLDPMVKAQALAAVAFNAFVSLPITKNGTPDALALTNLTATLELALAAAARADTGGNATVRSRLETFQTQLESFLADSTEDNLRETTKAWRDIQEALAASPPGGADPADVLARNTLAHQRIDALDAERAHHAQQQRDEELKKQREKTAKRQADLKKRPRWKPS